MQTEFVTGKKNLKGIDLTSLGISSPVFININDSLCQLLQDVLAKMQKTID